MQRCKQFHCFMLFCISGFITPVFAVDNTDTRMLSQPAVSANNIAFIYAEDLWVAKADGSQPRRLTIDRGVESSPVFSPDGKTIAFSAQYDGNTDVFTIPVEGGVPKRLTWHPSPDIVRGFTPDGKAVLFASQRNVFTGRYAQLFTVAVTGGMATQLEIPNAFWANYSPDAKYMAYTPLSDAFKQWKHYRGGTISIIHIFSFADKSVVKIPQPAEGCNDVSPMWIGNTIYFRSDRNGEFNLFAYNTATKKIDQLTKYKDFPVLNAGASNGNIVFEQAGYLHTYALNGTTATKLKIGIAADLLELRGRFVRGGDYIRAGDISPTGARVVFDSRGEIITAPAEKGDYRNITQTTGAHEKYPSWSPDGKTIAYFSDASGEYQLYLKPQDGKGEAKIFKLTGTGFYAYPEWSPDSKKINFTDNARNFYVLDIASGAITKIDADELYVPGPFRYMHGSWSFDSKWIAYTKITETQFKRVYLYSTEQKKSFALTDGLSDASDPKFDKSGKYLYFFASTDAGPVINWFDQSNADMRSTNSIYLVTLQKETISPFAKENDEEAIKPDTAAAGKSADKKSAAPDKKDDQLRIDWDGIENRIVDLPIAADNFGQLGAGKEGEIYYVVYPASNQGSGMLHKYDLKARKDAEVTAMDGYIISADGKKMLYSIGNSWVVTDAGSKPAPGKGNINTGAIQIKTDPATEWKNIFEEAWRVNRDYFYDPGMHGANWNAVKKKYETFLPDLACRSDLNLLIQWMCSELGVGHHRISNPGDQLYTPQRVSGGLLGADYTVNNNRYQIKKIYGGLNWNPNLKSPLTEPGVNVKTGDYIIAVNGNDVKATEDLYRYFENTAGKITEFTVSSTADGAASKTVKVVPIENESALRNRDWVEGNLKKVTEATNGQVAYVYVPNTADLGHDYFKRYFYPQANRKAIIVDERFNGGGQLADYYINLLLNPHQAYWNMRYGKDLKTPSASIQGPKVMLIDETAGSGGDMLPWMFRKFKVGTLVGKRTWGGLVGILGFPEFIDGGSVTAPNVAIWTKDGFIVENVGVAPDIEVEQTPSEVIKGNDPQLLKAIEVALKELEKNPPVTPARPPYPVRGNN
ncbi:S41 family peptidase [Ferruginibacter sp.]|nr:PD40 domain-containing protein [Ferruginibacter sp.]